MAQGDLRRRLVALAGVLVLVVLLAAAFWPVLGCAKRAVEAPSAEMMGEPLATLDSATEEEGAEEAAEAPPGGMAMDPSMAPQKGAGMGGMPGVPPPPPSDSMGMGRASQATVAEKALDKDAYYSSTYVGGSGERDRVEKLVKDGVVIDGKTVKLAAFTREYSQALEIPTKQALNTQVDLEQGKMLREGGEVHLQVGLQAIKREAPKRPVINLCLVIDRSGSMEDEGKLTYAKKAAMDVIDGLGAGDHLGVVVYDDAAQVLVPSQKLSQKASVKRKVETLVSGGATNIYHGLELAYGQVKRNFDKNGINQVIVLSDGMVTAGVEDRYSFRDMASKMADGDIQTTAVGMGIDFDETLMMGLAQAGRGGYHFIKDASETQAIFQEELGQLTRVVAKAVKLRIELPKGVDLLRVLGSDVLSDEEAKQVKGTEERIDDKVYDELGISRDRKKDDEPGIKMLIPHFYAGDSHVVMLKLRVPRGKGERVVAKVEVKYKDLVYKQNREVTQDAKIKYTTDKAATVASIRRPVKKNVLGFKTGEALLVAAERVKRGQVSEAARAIDEQMVVLGVAAREWKDEDLDRDGELLGRYKTVIASAGGGPLRDDLGNYLAKSMTYSGYELTR